MFYNNKGFKYFSVFLLIDRGRSQRCASICSAGSWEDIVIFGEAKILRRSHDSRLGKSAIHMVSAWANKAGLTLGQVKTDEKSNEIYRQFFKLSVFPIIVSLSFPNTINNLEHFINDRK